MLLDPLSALRLPRLPRLSRLSRLSRSQRSPRLLPALALVLILGGCALPVDRGEALAEGGRPVDAPARSGSLAGQSLAAMKTFQYITIDADQTGLANVADDGRYTYLAFAAEAPQNLVLFDAEGEPLDAMVRQGRIVALNGIHSSGILVRTSADPAQRPSHTFVAPNPRAQASDRPELEVDPELVEARSRLENLTRQGPAFRRAIERAEARQRDRRSGGSFGASAWPSAPAAAPSSPSSSPSSSSGSTWSASARSAASVQEAGVRPAAMALPLRGAAMPSRPVGSGSGGGGGGGDEALVQRLPNGTLLRVFFASGGRAIVRPDDGLARLENEALGADEVHIAGYTDGIGSESQNADLARGRAEAIQSLLVKRGVPPGRIFLTWHGTGRYLAENDSEQGRAMNRRAEVLFVRQAKGGQSRERYSAR